MDEKPQQSSFSRRYFNMCIVPPSLKTRRSIINLKKGKRGRMAITSGAALVAVRYARLADKKNQARWNKKRQKKRMDANSWWNEERKRVRRERERERERETTRRKGGWAERRGGKRRWVASNARMKGLGRTMENQDEGSLTWPRAIESKQSDDRPSKNISCSWEHVYACVCLCPFYLFFRGVCRGYGLWR